MFRLFSSQCGRAVCKYGIYAGSSGYGASWLTPSRARVPKVLVLAQGRCSVRSAQSTPQNWAPATPAADFDYVAAEEHAHMTLTEIFKMVGMVMLCAGLGHGVYYVRACSCVVVFKATLYDRHRTTQHVLWDLLCSYSTNCNV